MATIEERLRNIEGFQEVQQLKYEYCEACDDNYNPERIASLYAEDGVGDYGPDDYRIGRAAIVDKFTGECDRIPFASHMVVNPRIRIDGDHAEGKWILFMPCTKIIDGKAVDHWLSANYEDKYQRIDGVWKIKMLKVRAAFWSPHLEGWANDVLTGLKARLLMSNENWL